MNNARYKNSCEFTIRCLHTLGYFLFENISSVIVYVHMSSILVGTCLYVRI